MSLEACCTSHLEKACDVHAFLAVAYTCDISVRNCEEHTMAWCTVREQL